MFLVIPSFFLPKALNIAVSTGRSSGLLKFSPPSHPSRILGIGTVAEVTKTLLRLQAAGTAPEFPKKRITGFPIKHKMCYQHKCEDTGKSLQNIIQK